MSEQVEISAAALQLDGSVLTYSRCLYQKYPKGSSPIHKIHKISFCSSNVKSRCLSILWEIFPPTTSHRRIFTIILVSQDVGLSPSSGASPPWKFFIWNVNPSSDNFLNTDIFPKIGTGRWWPHPSGDHAGQKAWYRLIWRHKHLPPPPWSRLLTHSREIVLVAAES